MSTELLSSQQVEDDEPKIDTCLPISLLHFASEFSETVKLTPLQTRKDLSIPKSIKVRVNRLKDRDKAEKEKEHYRKNRYGVTTRQIMALRRLDYQINQIVDNPEMPKVDQVLTGMKMAWYAYAGGLIDESKRNEFINEIDKINGAEMVVIADTEAWSKVYREEISQVLPIV